MENIQWQPIETIPRPKYPEEKGPEIICKGRYCITHDSWSGAGNGFVPTHWAEVQG